MKVHLCFLKGVVGSWSEVVAFGAQNADAASKAVHSMRDVASSGMMQDAAGEETQFLKKMRGTLLVATSVAVRPLNRCLAGIFLRDYGASAKELWLSLEGVP